MPGVFISYRRSDTAPYATRLKERLSAAFGGEYVFMDVDSLRPGEPFPQVIEATIASSDAVLALIGHDWLNVTDAAGRRRLEDPGDFVRIELATALRFDRVVIPILIGHASMPPAEELPEPLVALVERHAIEVSDERWDTDTNRLVRRLEEVVDTIPPCPYPGMVPYRRTDAERFFGRAKEISEIEDRLATQRLLCLVGPSGCGKSSLLEAGVLADLERTQLGRWVICRMRPGGFPARGLSEALGVTFPGGALAPETARQAVAEVLSTRPAGSRLLLVVDQLEELFAQAEADEQARFIAALTAMHGSEHLAIVLAIRADFYGELMESALWPLVERTKVDVPPLAGDALTEAIAEPAKTCHVTLEPDLLERLLADAGKEPGALPLLQETLVRLWETMRLHRISLTAYDGLGSEGQSGLSAAVADTADAAVDSLPTEHLPIAKRVLLRLVQFGEGRPDTRRQLRFEDLRSEGDDDRALKGVLDRLARYRLLTLMGSAHAQGADGSGDDEATRRPHDDVRVDLAHEALISGWPTMRGWLAERRDAEQTRRRLEAHVETWEEHGRAAAFLDDVELKEAKGWLAGADARELGVPTGLSELVATSEARLTRGRQLRLGAIAGLVGLLIAALVLAVVFLQARNEAIHKANVARSRELAARATTSLPVDPYLSLPLAMQAVDALAGDDAATDADRRDAIAALRDAINGSRVRAVFRGHTKEVVSASFSPDGKRIVTASWDGTARVWNARTGKVQAVLGGHGTLLENAAFSPDGKLLVTAGDDGSARVWNAATGAELAVLQHERGSQVSSATFSPDGGLVLTTATDGTARVWDASSGKVKAVLSEPGEHSKNAAFSPDGKLAVTAGDPGLAVIWRVSTGKRLARLPHGPEAVNSARFSQDGRWVVTASDDNARVWNLSAPGKPLVLRGHTGRVESAEFSPDGRRIVTASLDHTARVWSVRTGKEVTARLAHDDTIRTATFSPDGTRIATASADQTARIWDTRTGEELAVLRGHDDYVGSAAFSPDGRRVVTSSFDGTARVWDAAISEPQFALGSGGYDVATAAFNPDGGRLVTTSPDGDPRIWSARTGAAISALAGNRARVVSAAFSADGTEVVTADRDGGVAIWNASSGQVEVSKRQKLDLVTALLSPDGAQIAALGIDNAADPPASTVLLWTRTRPEPVATWRLEGIALGGAFSENGRRFVAWTGDGEVAAWDVSTRAKLPTLTHHPAVRSAAFGPDGSLVATAGDDGAARIWDAVSGRELQQFRHASSVVSAAFNADGSRLLTASLDKTARIWNARTGKKLVSFSGHETELAGASFSPDGAWVVTAGLDGTARVWDALTGQQIALFRHSREVVSASINRDGRRVLTLSADFRARVFRCELCVSLDELVRLARSRLIPALE